VKDSSFGRSQRLFYSPFFRVPLSRPRPFFTLRALFVLTNRSPFNYDRRLPLSLERPSPILFLRVSPSQVSPSSQPLLKRALLKQESSSSLVAPTPPLFMSTLPDYSLARNKILCSSFIHIECSPFMRRSSASFFCFFAPPPERLCVVTALDEKGLHPPPQIQHSMSATFSPPPKPLGAFFLVLGSCSTEFGCGHSEPFSQHGRGGWSILPFSSPFPPLSSFSNERLTVVQSPLPSVECS